MSDGSRKRSRFDVTEPPPRSERRSRSPSSRDGGSRRSRSPNRSASGDPAAAAAAAAARINASLQGKRPSQHDGGPGRPGGSGASPSGSTGPGGSPNGDVYQQDGDYIKDIEVNDLRNRYTLTRGSTQKMIKEETGADITTRGSYYPDKTMATAANPPLYLHITSTSKDGLERAISKINELMQQELPNLVDERRFRRREPEQVERDEHGRRKWPEERIPIDLEPIPGFNLRAQVVGSGGAYVKHIQQETGCRVQIKGQGSGFTDRETGLESDEPMYLHVAGPDPNNVQKARELCESLLDTVREQYHAFKARGPRAGHGDRQGGGGQGYGQGQGGPQGYNAPGGYGAGGQGYPGAAPYGGPDAQSPIGGAGQSPIAAAGQAGAGQDYTAQWQQYYAQSGQDPYAAYGGYENYVKMYYAYYEQQQQQMQQQGGQPNPAGADGAAPQNSEDGYANPGVHVEQPPPPPPSDDPPPPPPPGAPTDDAPPPPPPPGDPRGSSGYTNVPPPPGT